MLFWEVIEIYAHSVQYSLWNMYWKMMIQNTKQSKQSQALQDFAKSSRHPAKMVYSSFELIHGAWYVIVSILYSM